MADSVELLRLRTLLFLLDTTSVDCGVTKIARALSEEKYTISRMLMSLEREGLVDRGGKIPVLTTEGRAVAEKYAKNIEITMNHLMYEGVEIETAKQDSLNWALCTSEKAMDVFRAADERYRVKYELRDRHSFNGADLCKLMNDGVYQFPFIIYREHIKNGSNLSMANDGFEHPCSLCVVDGVGTVLLKVKPMRGKSISTGTFMQGKVRNLMYLSYGHYIKAETSGSVISIPASCLSFVNIGSGVGQILHGSVCMKMECSVGLAHMPVSTAIFTIMI